MINAANTVVVVPCYNEAERLPRYRFRRFLTAHRDYHFLFVDDGSTDDTALTLQSLKREFPGQLSIVSLPHNCGKAEAVRQGILKALDGRPTGVAYWDADLATPLEEILRFRNVLDSCERIGLVMGCRLRLAGHDVCRRRTRRAAGRLFSGVASLVLSHPFRDTQCGAKMFRVTPDLRSVFDTPFASRWIFDVEILGRILAARPTNEIGLFELPLRAWTEIPGSRLSLRDCIEAARDLLRLGWKLRFRDCRSLNAPLPSANLPVPEGRRGLTPNIRWDEATASTTVVRTAGRKLSTTDSAGRAA